MKILGAHRGNRFAYQLPTADCLDIRLEHTGRVEDVILGRNIVCQARMFSIAHQWDLDSGSAITSIQFAVSQGGGDETDPLTVPGAPASTPSGMCRC